MKKTIIPPAIERLQAIVDRKIFTANNQKDIIELANAKTDEYMEMYFYLPKFFQNRIRKEVFNGILSDVISYGFQAKAAELAEQRK